MSDINCRVGLVGLGLGAYSTFVGRLLSTCPVCSLCLGCYSKSRDMTQFSVDHDYRPTHAVAGPAAAVWPNLVQYSRPYRI